MGFENKLVAVMNQSLEPGVAMNALSHLCLGFGAHLGKEPLHLETYMSKEGQAYPNISQMPFIILRGSGNKIRTLSQEAKAKGYACSVFLNTMTGGTYVEQLERTKATAEQDLQYYGTVLFGPWDDVSEMTKKFSLWK